ncbi:hypothetical protein K438DRAFT_1531069, partial [Mycena galopus ATCC 62051]
EERTLSWTEHSDKDNLFGHMVGKTRWVLLVSDVEEEFLTKNWTPDTIEHDVVQISLLSLSSIWRLHCIKSDTPKTGTSWIANQAWGIQEINGEQRYASNMKYTGPKGEGIEALLVYDY